MKIFETIINHKINTITAEELLKYASQFDVKITRLQAVKLADYLRGKDVNIFDDQERTSLVKQIAVVAGPQTAREVNKLFLQFAKKQ
ncbi:DUF2624 domain-containing protein [Mesobacillus zeae]|uniref:DUF2624 domain-containing protein n=1 Tax=Mesobacillus zeae TaxID=1917180 RepID=A0A398B1W0_9BACI|nr:DUF2624 domain-containing protein [Mesobacillus zeae]RID83825.1 DUF2624 domain-containing protein [Mesobacillus zeae]